MNKTQEALKMAIEALKYHPSEDDTIQACKEALAQPAPKNCTPLDEYIAEMEKDPEIKHLLNIAREDVKKWSTKPSLAPSWQGLSDDEIHNYADHNFAFASEHFDEIFKFARAIEQALKEKNHV